MFITTWLANNERYHEANAHPLLVVNPPLVILLDDHLYPSLPVAALQYNSLLTGCRNKHQTFNLWYEVSWICIITWYRWLTSGLRCESASEPSSGVTNPHTGFFLFSTSKLTQTNSNIWLVHLFILTNHYILRASSCSMWKRQIPVHIHIYITDFLAASRGSNERHERISSRESRWRAVDSHWMNQALQIALFRRILSLHSNRRPLKDFHLGETILPLQKICFSFMVI